MEAMLMEALKTFGAPVGELIFLWWLLASSKLYTSSAVKQLRAVDAERVLDAKEQAALWHAAHAESEKAREIQKEALRAALDVVRESEEGWDLFRVWLNTQAGVDPFSDRPPVTRKTRRPNEPGE